MNVQNKRSYAKESTKSKPTGIRFDIEKSDLVKSREKLNTFQKVVDFLLNKYWWECKIAAPSHKGLPPEPTPIENKAIVAPIPESEVKMPPKPQSEFIASVNDFEKRLRGIKSGSEGEAIMREVKVALMPFAQKQYLERVAKDVSANFFND